MAKKGGLILTPDVQARRQMAALGRDVRALGAAWNRTRARLVAEVERLGRLEAALEDDALAAQVIRWGCPVCGHKRTCSVCATGVYWQGKYRDALRAAMQDAPGQDGKEAGDA